MVNYVCAFSQSESGKYFEWIIIIIYNIFQSNMAQNIFLHFQFF